MAGEIGWVLVKGDGLAVAGSCEVVGVLFWADADTDYADIYDGLEAGSGKKFCRIETSITLTWDLLFPFPVPFERGVYVDGVDSAVETTIIYRQS